MNDLAYWTTKLQQAERELEAATGLADLNESAKRYMRIKAELRLLEERQAGGEATIPARVRGW